MNDFNRGVLASLPALRAFARTFCRHSSDADDLVQETLVKAFAHFHQFEPGTKLKSWLFTIMRNAHYSRYRIIDREAPGEDECVSARPCMEANQVWSIRSHEVRDAINQLPAEQSEVLVLVAVLGVSYEEAAQICGCAVGTIKSRLNRARTALLGMLGEPSTLSVVESDRHLPGGWS